MNLGLAHSSNSVQSAPRRRNRSSRRAPFPQHLFLVRVGANVVPDLIDLFVGERALPRGHLVLAVAHRVVEARTIVCGQSAQVEYLACANQAIAVADLAIVVVDILASLDL